MRHPKIMSQSDRLLSGEERNPAITCPKSQVIPAFMQIIRQSAPKIRPGSGSCASSNLWWAAAGTSGATKPRPQAVYPASNSAALRSDGRADLLQPVQDEITTWTGTAAFDEAHVTL